VSWEEDKERVRAATDLVALVSETVQLRQRGGEWWGCCPFHHEKTPSFKVNPSTGLWKCFGCGKGGDVFTYVMERESLDFVGALRYLADRAGIELSDDRGSRGPRRNRLTEELGEAETFYTTMLLRGKDASAARARAYLKGRGFGSAVCRRWGLGYAPGHAALVSHLRSKGFTSAELQAADLARERSGRLADVFFDRVTFPIHDEHGATIAFGARTMGDAKPKYLNSRDSSVFHKGKNLYAFDRAKADITAKATAIVCEGYTDVISMHEAGITNVVATLGTALTIDHIRLLERCRLDRIIFMFDGDAAGQRAAERALLFMDESTADLRCVILPDDLDPADFLAERGASAMAEQLAAARPLIDFVFEKRLAGMDLSVPGRRVAALDEMAGILAPLKRSVLLDEYATRLADAVGADVEETKRLIRSKPIQPAPRAAEPRQEAGRPATQATGAAQAPGVPASGGAAPMGAADGLPGTGSVVPQEPSAMMRMLSADERGQLTVERELLACMAREPDAFRPHAERIAGFTWSDARDQAIAWAILSTPEGTSPADAVVAAERIVPEAPRILAGGTLGDEPGAGGAQGEVVAFLLDVVELYSCRRKVREIRSRLASDQDASTAESLFQQATELQRHANELQSKLSAMYGQAGNRVR
jgi:DNA primase